MAAFKTKLITLAGLATVCSGLAYGQATLAAANPVTTSVGFIRAEGTTEILPATTVNLTGSVVGSISLTVYLSPSLTITSRTYGAGGANSEITATPNGGAAINGVVTGSTIQFNNIVTSAATTSVVIANIRVNATQLAVASGVPTGASEQIFLGGANATPGLAAPVIVAYAFSGLGTTTSSAVIAPANLICAAIAAGTLQFNVNVSENFANAFKTVAQESGTNGSAPATNGTRIAVTLANIPTNVTVYVPLTVTATGSTGVLSLITSPTATTAAGNLAAAAGTTAPLTTYGLVAIANNTGTVYYELTTPTAAGVIETYAIGVYYKSAAGALTAPATAATASVTFAPTTASPIANWPSFVISGTPTVVKGSSYAACSTTMLFPFVTNVAGFETGLAISNTGADLLALTGAGAPTSSVAGQTGTCLLTFFANATASSNPAAFTTGSITPGTTWSGTLTSVTGGTAGNVPGSYMIANCNFLYAHGFSYITYNIGQSSAMAMGYLALEAGTRAATTAAPESLGH